MAFTAFLSHSTKDERLVRLIARNLAVNNISPIVAVDVRPSSHPQLITDKVKNLLQQTDCVIAFLTKAGVESGWVQQEIGYSLDKKPIIPIVESGIEASQLAFLHGTEYIPIQRGDISPSILKLLSWTLNIKTEKENRDKIVTIGAIVLGIIALNNLE
jgi:nucleoside 2-deoxyribosyltransferase